ncbi:hypothetical protein SK128_025829 [Halocaridina rubra]|uniref:Serpin domain-containing protein n=1 Tax=Halocaridina rubra TaxID=373956 RepID=A0AAN8XEU8_HALRR
MTVLSVYCTLRRIILMYNNRLPLSCFILTAVLILCVQGARSSVVSADHFPSSIPLGWSGENSRLPLQQRGSAVPIIPDGHKKYQFYLYGPQGQLTLHWLTLQQVQNLLLAMDPRGEMYHMIPQMDRETPTPSANQSRPKDTVQQVITSVQQVVSDEVAQNQNQPNSPQNLNGTTGQSMEIPEVILQNLILLQHFTTPWYAPFTGQTSGPSENLNTESATLEAVTDITVTTPEIYTADSSTDNFTNVASVDDSLTTVLRPLMDRWNSRFPIWSMLANEEENGEDEKTNELDTTDDYHSLPSDASETVIPSSNGVQVDVGGATSSNYESEAAVDVHNKPEIDISGSQSVDKENSVLQSSAVDSIAHDQDLSDSVGEDLYQTTLGSIYGNTMITSKPEFAASSDSLDRDPNNFTNSLQPETTTLSEIQSAVINIATNLLDENIQTIIATRPLPTEEYLAQTVTENPFEITTFIPGFAVTNPYDSNKDDYSENAFGTQDGAASEQDSEPVIVPLEIRDPLLPLTVYDIQPIPDPTTTIPVQTEKPDNPYDTPTTFLTVTTSTRPEDHTDHPYKQDSTSQPETLLDLLQNQGYSTTLKDEQLKPFYEFPVYVHNSTTQDPVPTTVVSQQTTPGEVTSKVSNTFEVITQKYQSESIALNTHTTLNEGYSEKTITSVPTTQQIIENQSFISSEQNDPEILLDNYSSTETPPREEQSPTGERPTTQNSSSKPLFDEYLYYYYEDFGPQVNVLPPEQLANSDNQSRIDLEALQSEGNITDGHNFYDYLDQPVYLDDVPPEYFDYNVETQTQGTLNVTGDLDFPLPNATSPYHEHHHHHHHHHDAHHHHEHHHGDHHGDHHKDHGSTDNVAQLLEVPLDNPGLEATVEGLDPDIRNFIDAVNGITFKIYKEAAQQYKRKNFVMSPLSLISTLYILLLGARGSTSGALSDFLLSDQFYTFNPHLILKNVTDSILAMHRVHDVAFFKQLLVERAKNPYPMEFFSRTVDYFYGANISEVESQFFDKKLRETVNEVISKATRGAVPDFLSDSPLYLTPPLSLVSTNFFHGRWNVPITEADLFDMNFIRFPTAERRLIRTVGIQKRMILNAGYSQDVGVTVAEVPFYSPSGELSLVLVMPGEQKNFVANGLAQLEASMSVEKWGQILRSMVPNTVMMKMPFFRHRSFHNFSSILRDMGLEEIFKETDADFSGINTVKTLHVSDVIQLTEFQSCQVVESRGSGFSNSRRAKIMPGFYPDRHSLEKREALQPTGHYSPTFIYGLPMTEYLKRNVDNATPIGAVKDGNLGYFQNSSPNIIRFRPLSTSSSLPSVFWPPKASHSSITPDDDEKSVVKVEPSVESLEGHVNTKEELESKHSTQVVSQETREVGEADTEEPKLATSWETTNMDLMENTEEPKAASNWDGPNLEEANQGTENPWASNYHDEFSTEDSEGDTEKPKSASYWEGSFGNEVFGTNERSRVKPEHSYAGGVLTSAKPAISNSKDMEDDTTSSSLYDDPIPGYYYDYYGETNMYVDPDDYRVNRMGIPEGEGGADGMPEEAQSVAGEYYRQSDVGTLAFDRAFMYAVRHNPTGLLLFVGRYLDPEGN